VGAASAGRSRAATVEPIVSQMGDVAQDASRLGNRERAGALAADASGHAQSLSLQGGAGWTRGLHDTALAIKAGADVVVLDGMQGGTAATQDINAFDARRASEKASRRPEMLDDGHATAGCLGGGLDRDQEAEEPARVPFARLEHDRCDGRDQAGAHGSPHSRATSRNTLFRD